MQDNKLREFGLTTFALQNKNTIFLLVFIIIGFGILSYISLPKEQFPEVNMPTVFVQTTYPGNSAADIENLITRPIEKEIKTIKGINELTSTSAQDASMIFVEFTSKVNIDDAVDDVKDAVDKAKGELPGDLMSDPMVMDFDFSEFPIININMSGDYSVDELKQYAEYLEEELESIYEISKVEIKGLNEREIQINVDPLKMDAYTLSFQDIENAISAENMTMSGGDIKLGNTRRSIRIVGEFKNMKELGSTIIKHEKGDIVYLRDVAEVIDGYAEPKSFARLNHQVVVSVQVIKKSGENLLMATEKIFKTVNGAIRDGYVPEDIKISYTNDQSKNVKTQLSNLENNMLIAIFLVVGVLFFFLGLRNAIIVGLAIPMSMLLSFSVLGIMGITINMIVLFSLILALGMLVDNAIVVVENIYRYISQGYSLKDASKYAVGEIAVAIISSTATTLAAFFPLAFWDGIVGEFMKILPITLIIVLTSSLFVALILIPVIGSRVIRADGDTSYINKRKAWRAVGALLLASMLFFIFGSITMGNVFALFTIFGALNVLFFHKASIWFQNVLLVKLENVYLKAIRYSLYKNRPYWFLGSTILLLFVTIAFFGARDLKTVFFPENEPQLINMITELPIGTDVTATDSVMKVIENRVYEITEPHKDIVESVQTTVGQGVTRQNQFSIGNTPNRGLITIKFVDFEFRGGVKTSVIMRELAEKLHNAYPGVELFVEKNQNGPPTGNPINMEISGKDLDVILAYTDTIQTLIETAGIKGIEGLKLDITVGQPELLVNIDRDKARRFGLSTYQVASTIRTALFGKEISNFKEGEDEYPIQLRLQDQYRYNLATLMDQKIAFRNTRGQMVKVPISSVADLSFSTSYGTIKRKDMERVITVYSNVIEGYNANEINAAIQKAIKPLDLPDSYAISFTGEQQEQAETMSFLMRAAAIAVSLIMLILVSQFNSIVKPGIIIASVIFSTIGVLGGIATFKMDLVIIMTGVGIISLAGVVVNNAIVLIDYIDFLKTRRKAEIGMDEDYDLPMDEIKELIVQAGNTRLRPVLLTAITTILGLLPMAAGLNIDFAGFLSSYSPNIYFGGDNAIFWGPMSWTVIFGLSFATFLTLIIVPVMYLLSNQLKIWGLKVAGKN